MSSVLGDALKNYRLRQQFTQDQMAFLLEGEGWEGMDVPKYGRIERMGKNRTCKRNFSEAEVKATAKVLKVPVAVAWLYAYANDTEESRRRRDAAFSRRALKSQTFKCVSPQVPGEFVVFPVRVRKRGVAASRVVSLEADELRVELDTRARDAEGKIDSEGSLRALLEAALLPRFEAGAAEIVTFQGADGGPTGLAGGLALNRADFDLGRKVGCFLMDAAQGPS